MQQQLLAAFMLLASVDIGAFARHALPNASSSRIINGTTVPAFERVPYQVSVEVYIEWKFKDRCGGSIISPSHVLTAVQCCEFDVKLISVLAGVLELDDESGLRVAVNSYHIHEEYIKLYDNRKKNDIAILRLERDLPLDGIRLATIALGGREDVGDNVTVTLTGWGQINNYETIPNTLQRLNYHTIANNHCGKNGYPTKICARSPLGSACSSDIGSPLVMSTPQGLRLVGILSMGANCAEYPNVEPDVYTRLSEFDDWIQKHIQ